MVENKRTWKEKVHVETQVEERLRKNRAKETQKSTENCLQTNEKSR